MRTRNEIITRIRAHLPFAADAGCDISEQSELADLGVNSLHLITMLLSLQREYSLDIDRATELGTMPATVGELVTMVEQGMRRE